MSHPHQSCWIRIPTSHTRETLRSRVLADTAFGDALHTERGIRYLFPDPSTSPACYTESLFINYSPVATCTGIGGDGWISTFPHIGRASQCASAKCTTTISVSFNSTDSPKSQSPTSEHPQMPHRRSRHTCPLVFINELQSPGYLVSARVDAIHQPNVSFLRHLRQQALCIPAHLFPLPC